MTQAPPILMLFDGVCGFCSGGVRFILKRTPPHVQFCAMQSEVGLEYLERLKLPKDNYQTVVVMEGTALHYKSDAIIRLMIHMGGIWRFFAGGLRKIPRGIRDTAYDFIARHRFKIMGRRKTCFAPDESVRARFVS